jgi:hypothetical protein
MFFLCCSPHEREAVLEKTPVFEILPGDEFFLPKPLLEKIFSGG